jgi:hypothetical protein
MRLQISPQEGLTSPRRRPAPALILLVALGAILTAVARAHSIEQAPGMPRGCRTGDPLAGVHHPARLQTIKPCIEVTGTVAWAGEFPDGDHKFNLKLDSSSEHLLNEHNRSAQGGLLVCEIIPADQPGCIAGQPVEVRLGLLQRVEEWLQGPYEFGICTGANIGLPATGARVRVVGPYVVDLPRGWTEIHPVWSIEGFN